MKFIMNISRYDSETSAFVMGWEDIEKLYNEVKQKLPDITISVLCVDKLKREFKSIDELKNYKNSKRSAINKLTIVARDIERENRLSISFSSNKYKNIDLSLDANEDIGIKLNDMYIDFIESLRPWYSAIARADWYYVILGIYLLFQLGMIAIALIKTGSISFKLSKENTSDLIFIKSFLFSILIFVFCALISKMAYRFFPMGTFAFGDGKNRHKKNEVIRTVFIAAFVVSIISSLVFSWF